MLKCTLLFSNMGKSSRLTGLKDFTDAAEKQFLSDAFGILWPKLETTSNDTTQYSPLGVSSGQKSRGSSLESSAQRSQYTSIPTTGVTGQVLNVSFKNKNKKVPKTPLLQVTEASSAVIKFLLSSSEPFRNHYSMIMFETCELNWTAGSNDTFLVPGGLLFPLLTALLISYRSDDGTILVVESYGGKRRGVHEHWSFPMNGSFDATVNSTITQLKESERKKIPFLIKESFAAISLRWSFAISTVSLHWGLGCDAQGGNLSDGKPSFLVCQPVTIELVDKIRAGPAKAVFMNHGNVTSNVKRSNVTKQAATTAESHNCSSDDDRSDDEAVDTPSFRYR